MPHLEVFYTPPDHIDTTVGILKIVGQEAHHITNVLRHKPGNRVVVVDGCGTAYWVLLSEVSAGAVTGTIEKKENAWGESTPAIGVIIPPLKSQRMEMVIEKGTELGVSWFHIPQTQHTVAKATPEKLDRWQRIALAAMKQCGRSICPRLLCFPDLKSAIEAAHTSILPIAVDSATRATTIHQPQVCIIYAEMWKPTLSQNVNTIRETISDSKNIIFIAVGPEGGFSQDELQLLTNEGAIPFGIAPRRLRSDTAIIASLAQLLNIL